MANTTTLTAPGKEAGLNDWLGYISKIHEKPMDLGLERMKEMIARMGIEFECPVFTVAGTNGKGSTCALLESILRYAGYRVGMHTSPHLLRFNERCVIAGDEVDDETLIAAFKAVDAARGDMPLTYFEFTGLAILKIFQDAKLDAVILEIGLGGRLDAMNAIDTDCAILCSIGIDHAAYLGDTREKIGWEKAHIMRHDKPVIVTDPNPPQTVYDYAHELLAPIYVWNKNFFTYRHHGMWDFEMELRSMATIHTTEWRNLPKPAISGVAQLQNAAGALAALAVMQDFLPVTRSAVVEGLENVVIAARFEHVKNADEHGAAVTIDVGHNPQAAEVLAENLARTTQPGEKVWAVFGMFADKDMASVARIMNRHIDRWFVTGLPKPRGAEAIELMDAMEEGGVDMGKVVTCASVDDALRKALAESVTEGPETVKIIGFGSFVTVTGIMESLKHDLREEQLASGEVK